MMDSDFSSFIIAEMDGEAAYKGPEKPLGEKTIHRFPPSDKPLIVNLTDQVNEDASPPLIHTFHTDKREISTSNPLQHQKMGFMPFTTEAIVKNSTSSQQLTGSRNQAQQNMKWQPQKGRKKSVEDYYSFSRLGLQQAEPIGANELADEQSIIDAMSHLEGKHKQIIERRLAQKAKEEQEAEARKALLNHISSVETQIKTMDVLRDKLLNDRTRDAAEHMLVDATKV